MGWLMGMMHENKIGKPECWDDNLLEMITVYIIYIYIYIYIYICVYM